MLLGQPKCIMPYPRDGSHAMSDEPSREGDEEKAPDDSLRNTGSADVTERAALDDDSPGEVRRTFVVLMVVGAIICTIPRQYGSALVMLGAAVIITVTHLVLRRRAGSSS